MYAISGIEAIPATLTTLVGNTARQGCNDDRKMFFFSRVYFLYREVYFQERVYPPVIEGNNFLRAQFDTVNIYRQETKKNTNFYLCFCIFNASDSVSKIVAEKQIHLGKMQDV